MESRRATDEGPPTGVPERRRYNRRTTPGEVSPPYFEVFERIAIALEEIQQALTSPPAPAKARSTGRRTPSPRSE